MDGLKTFFDHYNYVATILLMVAGLYIVIARGNMIKKLIGLSLFQTSVYLLYIAPGKIFGGTAPILDPAIKVYSDPLPHVLILTAIVVGVVACVLGILFEKLNVSYLVGWAFSVAASANLPALVMLPRRWLFSPLLRQPGVRPQ